MLVTSVTTYYPLAVSSVYSSVYVAYVGLAVSMSIKGVSLFVGTMLLVRSLLTLAVYY